MSPPDAPLDETQTESQLSIPETDALENLQPQDTPDSAAQSIDPPFTLLVHQPQQEHITSAAIEFLSNLSCERAKDHHTHQFIEEAVYYLTTFIDSLLSTHTPTDSTKCVVHILSPSFVAQLFRLRVVFRAMAATKRRRIDAKATVISWVDDLLVKLCACILHLATSGALQDFKKYTRSESIKSLQENEARRAAAQLPAKFSELSDTLVSRYSSPAMARLSLTLIYGTTVLRERFGRHVDPSDELNLENLTSVISSCITKYGINHSSPSSKRPLTLFEYAILVSVYTYSVRPGVKYTFAPQTEHSIVELVDLILDTVLHDSTEPSNTTLALSSILVRDASLIEWFWDRWGDGTTLLASTGLRLTRHWIQEYQYGDCDRRQKLISTLLNRRPKCFQILLHLLESPTAETFSQDSIPSNDVLLSEVLCRAYLALVTTIPRDDLQYQQVLAEACRRLCPYVAMRSASNEVGTVRKLLVALLASVDSAVIRTAFGDTPNPSSNNNGRVLVEKIIQEVEMMTRTDQENPRPDDQATLKDTFDSEKLKYMLDFLAVLLHANTSASSEIVLHPSFLPRLASWMSKSLDKRSEGQPIQWKLLRASGLLLLGCAYRHFKAFCSVNTRFPEYEQNLLFEAVLDEEGDQLLETCALSGYMLATEDIRILDDPVIVLRIWSRIRDILLAICQHRFLGEEESVSVAISGALCASLLSILRTMGRRTRATIFASPWTQTLKTELEEVLAQSKRSDDFKSRLAGRMKEIRQSLICQIDGIESSHGSEVCVNMAAVDAEGWIHLVLIVDR